MSKGKLLSTDVYRVKPGTRVDLGAWVPDDKGNFAGGKSEGKDALKPLRDRLSDLQEVLYAEHKHKLLIVLQAMDTGGKDGTIRKVFREVNPQGVHVQGFKVPTALELAHDYLWRVHAHTPGSGEIAIFNRSHYEDVLVVRVHELVPPEVWSRRYEHINAFEKLLADEGTTILKFYLHISLDEQKERLQARLDDPDKHWKFNIGDLAERARWPEYVRAYEDVLSKTSTEWAPWYIIPANRKWYRNLVVASTIIETLESLEMRFPESEDDLSGVVIK
jgi:PPK2 family polyphosphate:nucleotide phosphotransferase